MGHLDAMHSIELAEDYYFMFLSLVGLFIFLSLAAAYRLFESKFLSFKQFIGFTGVSTLLLPVSVWGLAWISWFSIKDGYLTLWKIGAIKISIPWNIFMPFHISITVLFVAIVGYIIHYKLSE